MAYTPSGLRTKTNLTFNGLVDDGNRVAMTGALGSAIQTQDATASPVSSPVTVNTTQTLTVPSNAVAVTIISVSNAVQVSEDSTQSAYFSVPAATPVTFDVARQQYIYLKTGSSTVVSFVFSLV